MKGNSLLRRLRCEDQLRGLLEEKVLGGRRPLTQNTYGVPRARPDLRKVPSKMDICDVRAAIEAFEEDVETKRRGWEHRY